jgi:hypothetical protein
MLSAARDQLFRPREAAPPDPLSEPRDDLPDELPEEAPRLRVRSSTSPVRASSAACVESSDVMPRPITRRPDPPEAEELPVFAPLAFPDPPPLALRPPLPLIPPFFFFAMPSSGSKFGRLRALRVPEG